MVGQRGAGGGGTRAVRGGSADPAAPVLPAAVAVAARRDRASRLLGDDFSGGSTPGCGRAAAAPFVAYGGLPPLNTCAGARPPGLGRGDGGYHLTSLALYWSAPCCSGGSAVASAWRRPLCRGGLAVARLAVLVRAAVIIRSARAGAAALWLGLRCSGRRRRRWSGAGGRRARLGAYPVNRRAGSSSRLVVGFDRWLARAAGASAGARRRVPSRSSATWCSTRGHGDRPGTFFTAHLAGASGADAFRRLPLIGRLQPGGLPRPVCRSSWRRSRCRPRRVAWRGATP